MSDAKHVGSNDAAPDTVRPLLATLVGDTRAFAEQCWGRRPAVFHPQARFDHLLSGAAVCDLLEHATRRPNLRMVRNGTVLSPQDYTTSVRMGGTMTSDVADVERIAAQFATGATLVVQSLERIHPPLRAFARELHREISHPVQANAYLSPPTAAALAPHSDRHDVFVVQLEGSKSWEVEGMGSVELVAGDVLYMPTGCTHGATTTHRHSLHLTLGVLSVTYGDVLQRVVRSLDQCLDRPLPLGYAHEDARTELAAAIDTMLREAAPGLLAANTASVARAEQQRAQRGHTASGGLRRELALAGLNDAARIRASAGAAVSIEDSQAVLTFDDGELRMPTVAAPALAALVASDVVTVGDLTGLDEASRLVLARRLVREGAAELLDGDAPSRDCAHAHAREV